MYKSKDGHATGVTSLSLAAASTSLGTAKFSLKAGGSNFPAPGLPLAQTLNPVRVLLVNASNSVTWCARYSAPPRTDALSATKWKDKNDTAVASGFCRHHSWRIARLTNLAMLGIAELRPQLVNFCRPCR